MSQIPRPNSDVSNTGVVSTGGALYTEIDESVASDSDYLTFSGGVADTCTVGLETPGDPGVYNDWVVTARLAHLDSFATGDMKMDVALYEGASLVESFTSVALSTLIANYTFAIADASSISDYSALRLRFTNNTASGGNLDVYLYQAFLTMGDYEQSGGGEVTAARTIVQCQHPQPRVSAISGETSTLTGVDKADLPVDIQDAIGGKVCSFSGLWFPARRVVIVQGLPYGDIYAPKDSPGPIGDILP